MKKDNLWEKTSEKNFSERYLEQKAGEQSVIKPYNSKVYETF